jgi:predicted DNA-binding transcriptional regulator YafY
VCTEKGKGGGIRLIPEFTLNRSVFTEKEQGEIISALQALEAVEPKGDNQVLTKISAIFNSNGIHWLDMDFSNWTREDSKMFIKLKTAIIDKKVVVFDYYSRKGEKTNRSVEPLQLFFKLIRVKNLMITA